MKIFIIHIWALCLPSFLGFKVGFIHWQNSLLAYIYFAYIISFSFVYKKAIIKYKLIFWITQKRLPNARPHAFELLLFQFYVVLLFQKKFLLWFSFLIYDTEFLDMFHFKIVQSLIGSLCVIRIFKSATVYAFQLIMLPKDLRKLKERDSLNCQILSL